METINFGVDRSEKRVIDEVQKVASVKTNVHIDEWSANGTELSVSFTYIARYLGQESILRIPEIANITINGRITFSVTEKQISEVNAFRNAQAASRGPFTILDSSNPNYAKLTLPDNYYMEINRTADEKCKPYAVEFLNSLSQQPSDAQH